MSSDRNISTGGGNYNENIAGDYVQGNKGDIINNIQNVGNPAKIETRFYPLPYLYPNGLVKMLYELRHYYIAPVAFIPNCEDGLLGALGRGLTPIFGFIFKKNNTIGDYLAVVADLAIYHPQNYRGGDSRGDSSARFTQVILLLEYLSSIDECGCVGSGLVMNTFNYEGEISDSDYSGLERPKIEHLLNKFAPAIPIETLNPLWQRKEPLFEKSQGIEALKRGIDSGVHELLGLGIYGIPSSIVEDQMFHVWETGYKRPKHLNCREMARVLRNFLRTIPSAYGQRYLCDLYSPYAVINFCSWTDSETGVEKMETAFVVTNPDDSKRLEIVPSGWGKCFFVARTPSTKHFDHNLLGSDPSPFKLFDF